MYDCIDYQLTPSLLHPLQYLDEGLYYAVNPLFETIPY